MYIHHFRQTFKILNGSEILPLSEKHAVHVKYINKL